MRLFVFPTRGRSNLPGILLRMWRKYGGKLILYRVARVYIHTEKEKLCCASESLRVMAKLQS